MTLDPLTFVLEILNFFVLLWLLKRFLYRPVLTSIEKRQTEQQRVLQEANDRMQQAESLHQQYETRLHEWANEKASEQAKLHQELVEEKEKQLTRIKAAAADEQARLEARRQDESRVLLTSLRKQARQEVFAFASQLLQRLSGAELTGRFVAILLDDLQHLAEDEQQRLRQAAEHAAGKFRIVSSHELAPEFKQSLEQSFNVILQRELMPDYVIEPALLGGLRIEIGTCVLHANIAEELSWFSDQIEHHHD